MVFNFVLLSFFGTLAVAGRPHQAPVLPANAIRLPLHTQETSYSCGPASLLPVLQYWTQYSGKEKDLYYPLKTDKKAGTDPRNIVKYLETLPLKVSMREHTDLSTLRSAVERGTTVIVDYQAWREDTQVPWKDRWEDGHYSVVIGMDVEYLYFMDPSTDGNYAYIPIPEFLERWHDFEKTDGVLWKNYELAIFIEGANAFPLVQPPTKLTKIE